jgi:dipeptidyl aminopeptidase/acylaminoacyl peptidase
MKRLLSILALLAALLVASCGGDRPSSGGQAGSGSAATGTLDHGLLVPRDQRLLLRDMKDGKEATMFRAPPDAYFMWPRWSPDGRSVAAVANVQYTGIPSQDWGGDIIVSAPNGSNQRTVFKHPQAGVSIEGLAWAPDGSALIAGVMETTIKDGRFLGQTLKLDRIALADGARTTLVEDAAYPAVARDGSRMAFITYATGDQPGGLWVSKLDGSDRRLIVPTGGAFVSVLYPQFAPDGRSLTFSAVYLSGSGAAPVRATERAAWRWPWQPRIAAAHGLPMDVWSVPVEGGEAQRLTHFLEDEPMAAFSPDGKELAIIATGGLYVMPATGGEPKKVGLGGAQAQIDWR